MINWNKWLEEKRLVNQEIKRALQPAIEVPPYQMAKRALAAPAYPTHASKRGIHWSASCYPVHANYEYHLDRMVEAGIGWVKYLSDGNGRPGAGDSGLQFGINVLSRGMVPIVRYYMDAGHKWTDANDYATEQNVAHGILMIETINEPDLDYEWADGKLPQDWAERSFTNWIEHAQRIIAHGGIPLSPSLASGFMQARGEGAGQLMLNPFKLVKAAGVERFVCGIHNYPLNHPIDYPYDDVNQKGTSLTQAEYERVGGSYAWDSQSIEQINAWRESDKNPGDGIYDDDSCFNAVEIFIDMLDAAGLPDVPIFTTEGGPCLTDRHDRRYPRVTPVVQEDMVADELQAMARNHRYMGYAWWLWGNNSVGGTGGWMTNQWYWPGGPFSDSNGFIPEFQYLKDHKVSDDGNDDDGDDDGNDGEDDNNDGGDDYVEPETDNQAINYGVVVDHPDVEEGKPYWKCILVKHYPPCENQGKHHVYMDAIDEDGKRVNGQTLLVNDIPVVIDKPPNEPGTNAPMWKNTKYYVTVADGIPSSVVLNLHTAHPDEMCAATGTLGNSLYHHSFYLLFKRVKKQSGGGDDGGTDVPNEESIREMAWNKAGVSYNPDAMFQRYARDHGLGNPLVGEAGNEFDWQGCRFQLFTGGIVYAPIDKWGETTHIAW